MSWYWLASVILSVFYIAIALLALRPQVSADYAAYYIQRTSTISPGELKRDRTDSATGAGFGSRRSAD